MRSRIALAALAALLLLPAVVPAATLPKPGHYADVGSDYSVAFEVKRLRGRLSVTGLAGAFNRPCERNGSQSGAILLVPLPIDDRGFCEGKKRDLRKITSGLVRFRGSGASGRVNAQGAGCNETVNFRAVRTTGAKVRPGRWTGMVAGQSFTFEVSRDGRFADFTGSRIELEAPCPGGTTRLVNRTQLKFGVEIPGRGVPLLADRKLNLTERFAAGEDRTVTTLAGSFSSETAFSGTIRLATTRGSQTCDTGALPVVASPG